MLFKNDIGEIRPFALADRFKARRLRRKVKAPYAGKQAYMGKFGVYIIVTS